MGENDFSSEDRDLLERTFKLARDNNRMLQSMNRAAMFNGLFRFLAWGVVLAGSVWLYFNYLGPLMESTTGMLNQAQGVSSDASNQFETLKNAFDALQKVLPNISTTTPQ